MKFFIALLLSVASITACAQFNVKISVSALNPKHVDDSVHVAGSFNGWNPASAQSCVLNRSGKGLIELYLEKGNYDYKFTRGSWDKGETNAAGIALANRQLSIHSDTTFSVTISGWQDDFSSGIAEQKSTASKHVFVMDTAFNMPQLNRLRRVWLYLPEGYHTSSKKYPVLYMHDGQNLFDNATSGFGEWGIDEFLDSVKNTRQCIIVGIDNGGSSRLNEYSFHDFNAKGTYAIENIKAEGTFYIDFIVSTLKPYIDLHYKTKSSQKNTFIAGSSMGGLISFYAVLKYPETFGGAGIFSPAFGTANGIDTNILKLSNAVRSKLFFYAGGNESEKMLPDMKRIEALLMHCSPAKIKEEIDSEALHNEAAWQKHFPSFYHWIFK